MFNTTTSTTIDRIELRAKDKRFLDVKPLTNFITSNILKFKVSNLDELGEYFWVVKSQPKLLNIDSLHTGTFTLAGADTDQDLDIPLVDTKYSAGNTYYFGLRKVGGDEVIQISFTISQNIVLATGTDIINNLPGGAVTYNGLEVNTTNNKILTEGSLELDDITVFNNLRIPTNLAVQTFVNNAIQGFNLNGNTSFDDLELRVSTNESDIIDLQTGKRNITDSYSRAEIDTKDSNTLTSANNFTTSVVSTLDGQLGTVAKSNNYNDLNNKPDLTVLEEVLVFPNLASFPVTGETQKVYIAENTGFMYRWSGSAYIQLTDQTAIWGEISGTLSNQTDLQNALNGKVNKNGDETINGIKTFGNIPVLPSSNPTNANQSTRKGYVDGLDSGNVKTTGDQTIAGTKTFSSPVGVASPEADGDAVNRLYTTNIQPQIITNTIKQYLARTNADGFIVSPGKQIRLEDKFREILKITNTLLPDFYLTADSSFNEANTTGTKGYNAGIVNGGDVTLINGGISNFIANNQINFLASSSRYITTTYQMQDNLDNWTYILVLDRPFVDNAGLNQTLFDGMVASNSYRVFVGGNLIPYFNERSTAESLPNNLNIPAEPDNLFASKRAAGAINMLTNTTVGANATPSANMENRPLQIGARRNLAEFLNSGIKAFLHFRGVALTNSQIRAIYNLF